MKITFEEVKWYMHRNCPNAIERIIDSTEPFVMDYVNCPVGYAETDNLNDIDELTKEIDKHFEEIDVIYDGRVRKGIISRIIKTETTRWNIERNAWYYGRHIGRLAYLLNKEENLTKLRNEYQAEIDRREAFKKRVLSYTTFI